MKTFLYLLVALFAAGFAVAQDVYVSPYMRKDGTFIDGHFRTAPDGTINNNFTTYPNVNPYTGKQGYIQPQSNVGYYPVVREREYLNTSYVAPSGAYTDFDAEGIARLASPRFEMEVAAATIDKTTLNSMPDDFNPKNDYYFGRDVAAPVKGALEIKSSTPPPVKKFQSSGLEMEGTLIFIAAILGIIFLAVKLK